MKRRALLKDDKLNASIEEDGFTVVPFLGREELEALRDVFKKYYGNSLESGVFNTLETTTAERRKKIHDDILEICKAELDKYCANFKIIIAVFFIKNPGDVSNIAIHHDPSMTHENYHHLGIWIPLVDTHEENGSMHFVRYSHKFFPRYYAKTVPAPYANVTNVISEHMESVDMKAGEAIIFDNNTVHCSSSNHSNTPRVAAGIKIIDKDAQLITLFRDPKQQDGKIKIIDHGDDFYLSPLYDDSYNHPKSGKDAGFLEYEIKTVSEREMRKIIYRHNPLSYRLKNSLNRIGKKIFQATYFS